MSEPERHRRRRRAPRAAAAEDRAGTPPPTERDAEPAGEGRTVERRQRRGESTGLRGIVGAGPSQLGVSGALRGRDVNRPTDDDIAEAEQDVHLVRRHWKPPS